ncbi:NHL repeat protein [compost metagenome]
MTSSSGGFVGATDLARDPRNANLYGVSGNYLYRLEPTDRDDDDDDNDGYNQPIGTLIHNRDLVAVTVDPDGDVFVLTEDGELKMLDASENKLLFVAGTLTGNNYADGVGAAAGLGTAGRLVSPSAGVVYMADQGASSFRRITFNKQAAGGPVGTVKTLAGFPAGTAGNRAGCRDGRGALARFDAPGGLARATDGSFYISEPNSFAIRKVVVDTAADVGVVSTIAGNNQAYADGVGSAAEFNTLGRNLAIDGDNLLYVADTGPFPYNAPKAIRRIDPATRQVTTVSGGPGSNAVMTPKIVLVEQSGDLLVTESPTVVKRLRLVGSPP